MSRIFKFNAFSLSAASGLVSGLLLSGCGGGGSGGNGGGTPSGTPSPFDGTYTGTTVPTMGVPDDGRAPSSTVVVTNGRGKAQFTYYLQTSVVAAVQAAVNKGLTDAGYAGDIPNNQVPASITFTPTGQVDGSGKLVLTQGVSSRSVVGICGNARVTVNAPLPGSGATPAQGTYTVIFAKKLQGLVRGKTIDVSESTCNNLPLRDGTISYAK